MQRWSKFQSQSKKLNKEFLFALFAVVLISMPFHAFGQVAKPDGWVSEEERKELMDRGILVNEQLMVFQISRDSSIKVKHVIETGSWAESQPRIIEILEGPHSNVRVIDEDGDRHAFAFVGETFEESEHVILKQKPSCCDLILEYELENFLELNNNLWKKEIKYSNDVMMIFDEEIDIIFVNSRPIELEDASGINCVGCYMMLEFFDKEKIIKQEIIFNEEKFVIEILTENDISEVKFFGGGNDILNFNVNEKDQLFILKIPFELFLNPFDVYLTEKNDMELDQVDKIRMTEYGQDATHVNLSFRADKEGTISILGATQKEHDMKAERIEKTRLLETQSSVIEQEKGIAIPMPGQTDNKENSQVGMTSMGEGKLSFEDELKEVEMRNSYDFLTIIVIVGIIAAIIIPIIIKVKKS